MVWVTAPHLRECALLGGRSGWRGRAQGRASRRSEDVCGQEISPGSPPLPARSPMTTALTVSRMKAFRRRKRSTCSRVMVCRRRRVRSALCCRLSCSRCSQPTRPSRWPLSRKNRLFPWLLIVYLRGTQGPCGEGQEKGPKELARKSERIQTPGEGRCPPIGRCPS